MGAFALRLMRHKWIGHSVKPRLRNAKVKIERMSNNLNQGD
jgi:hypothetical protein